jgi:hypothetical protein
MQTPGYSRNLISFIKVKAVSFTMHLTCEINNTIEKILIHIWSNPVKRRAHGISLHLHRAIQLFCNTWLGPPALLSCLQNTYVVCYDPCAPHLFVFVWCELLPLQPITCLKFISSLVFSVCREDLARAPLVGSAALRPVGVRGRQDAVAARPPADAHPSSCHVLPPWVSVISHHLHHVSCLFRCKITMHHNSKPLCWVDASYHGILVQ